MSALSDFRKDESRRIELRQWLATDLGRAVTTVITAECLGCDEMDGTTAVAPGINYLEIKALRGEHFEGRKAILKLLTRDMIAALPASVKEQEPWATGVQHG